MQASQPSQADQGGGGRGAAGHEGTSSKETVSAEAGPAAMQVDERAALKEPVGTLLPPVCCASLHLPHRVIPFAACLRPTGASHQGAARLIMSPVA